MKKIVPFVLVLITTVILFSCSETKSEAEYYKLAYDQYNDGKYDESVDNFKNLLENYPEGKNTPNAMFMIGFICANNLEKYDEAKKYYTMFMEKYPDHELYSSAKYELDNVGKDINELDIFKNIEKEEKEN